MTRWLILALLLVSSLAYAGQGMGPGPGAKTYASAANYFNEPFATADGWVSSNNIAPANASLWVSGVGHNANGSWDLSAGDGEAGGQVGFSRSLSTGVAAGTMSLWFKYDVPGGSIDPGNLSVRVNGVMKLNSYIIGIAGEDDGNWHQISFPISAVSGSTSIEIWWATSGGAAWIDDIQVPIP